MKMKILPQCTCGKEPDDNRLYRCEDCDGYYKGKMFGMPIEKFKGSYYGKET